MDRLEKANRDHTLYARRQKIVVGLSGGADSVGLLHLLKRQEKNQELNIVAAHLDHGYHAQSARQMRFCRALCKKLHIPFYTRSIRLSALAKKQKRSLEEAGRLARYDFFSDVCRKTGAKLVATAHTLDDQAETVLMRLFRGTGLRGLVAIPWKRREKGFVLIRPLLYCEKNELLRWLKSEQIAYCDDPTNRDEAFTRNFVRRQLLPLLEKRMNPQAKRALADYQSAFQDGFDFIESAAQSLYKRCVRTQRGSLFIQQTPGAPHPPAVVDEMLRMALSKLKGDYRGVGFDQIRKMRHLYADRERAGKQLQFPGSWVAIREKTGLRITAARAR